MNRKTDPINFDAKALRHDICLKETEWREIHDHIAGTKMYRQALCEKLDIIRSEIKGWNSRIWGLALIIIPAIISLAAVAGTDHDLLMRNTKKWELQEETNHDVKVLKEKSYGYNNIKVVTE